MIEILDKAKCSGCEACAASCPKQCIQMQADSEGFQYPVANKEQCIQCKICDTVCPIQFKSNRNAVKYTVVAQHKVPEQRYNSASGGAFFGLAETVIESGGIVYGVVFDENFFVKHKRAESLADVEAMQGSKYVQSEMKDIYKTLRSDLESGRMVLFSGTPCQVEGIKRWLKKDYSNLYTVDLVCHGVASPKVWNKYCNFLEKQHGSSMKSYSFRSKEKGYHLNGTKICFKNGDEIYANDKSEKNDFMHLAYYDKICSRPSCHDCAFKSLERISDLTLFDCWSLSEVAPEMEDDMGTTTIMVYTEKGNDLLRESAGKLRIKKVDGSKLIQLDGVNAIYSMIPHLKRAEFFSHLDEWDIERLQKEYLVRKEASLIYKIIKQLIVKIGLLGFAQKIKFSILGKMKKI